jgi:hypothetical protein
MIAIRYLAWAWLIIIGGLMFTPGGVSCIACGAALNSVLAAVSIVLGVAGFVSEYMARRTLSQGG